MLAHLVGDTKEECPEHRAKRLECALLGPSLLSESLAVAITLCNVDWFCFPFPENPSSLQFYGLQLLLFAVHFPSILGVKCFFIVASLLSLHGTYLVKAVSCCDSH